MSWFSVCMECHKLQFVKKSETKSAQSLCFFHGRRNSVSEMYFPVISRGISASVSNIHCMYIMLKKQIRILIFLRNCYNLPILTVI